MFSTREMIFFFSRCRPTMNVTVWANHGSDICGISDNVDFTKFSTILRYPLPQGFTHFDTVLNPTTFPRVQIEASNMIHGLKCGCKRSHQVPKRRSSHSEVVSVSTLGRLQEVQILWISLSNSLLKPSEDRAECHCNKKAARKTALFYNSGHKELSSSCSLEFHVRGAVAINTTPEAINKNRQFCLLDDGEDPGVIDAGICSSRICQQYAWCLRSARNMGQSSGLNLKKCCPSSAWMRYIFAKDVCISWCTNEGLDRWQRKKFAITIAQRQWSKSVWRSNNSSIVVGVRGL